MKKLSLIFICCLLLFSTLSLKSFDADTYQNDLTMENLKGKVKSYTEFYYDTYKAGNDIDSDWSYKIIDTFNTKGNVKSFLELGNPSQKPVQQGFGAFYTYDNYGKLTIVKDLSGKIAQKTIYSLNKEKHVVAGSSFGSSHITLKIINNKDGNRDTMYSYDIAGKFMNKTIYHYNKNRDLIELIKDDTLGKIDRKSTYNYDNNHNKISEVNRNNSGLDDSKIYYVYDDLGNMIMERDSNTTYIGGNRIFDADPGNKEILIFKCKYGNFDRHHNWLRQDMYHNNTIAKTFKRKIVYYPEN